MQIFESTVGDVTILEVDGKVLLGEGDIILMRKIDELVLEGRVKVVFKLTFDGRAMDSGGLGEVVRSYTKLHNKGGNFKIVTDNKSFLDLLTITKLLTVFEIYKDLDDAVASYG